MRAVDSHTAHRRIKSYYIVSRKTLSRIGKLTLNMLGSRKHPRLKAKAAETRHLMPFLPQMLRQFGALLGPRAHHLTKCLDGLLKFYDVCAKEPRQLSVAGLQTLQSSVLLCLNSWRAYRGKLVYRFHIFWHIAERAEWLGNPRFSWTYPDEELNRQLGTVAKVLHKGRRFYVSFLQRVLLEIC